MFKIGLIIHLGFLSIFFNFFIMQNFTVSEMKKMKSMRLCGKQKLRDRLGTLKVSLQQNDTPIVSLRVLDEIFNNIKMRHGEDILNWGDEKIFLSLPMLYDSPFFASGVPCMLYAAGAETQCLLLLHVIPSGKDSEWNFSSSQVSSWSLKNHVNFCLKTYFSNTCFARS
ncbi:hypothetical protein DCAR_0311267 [Daucus carota subsp. sativus]|uniref:Uncharacterized protein n=1 Tax=Daucus carota subsp. sativus TaxID=79200 RepID=A0AAF1ATN5_DAUCS|nr:PREDICTED: uncharacterized protein LOC108213600 [Daucus carota subsp. sativus]WOG92011.1 hypothetical protein DCAR_0311267 [Daucus carota subsp. sativus]